MRSLLALLVIVGIVILAVVFSQVKTGALVASRFCPEGTSPVLQGVPGGGLQVVDCVAERPIAAIGDTFDTYTAHPQGDLRRQRIARRGASF